MAELMFNAVLGLAALVAVLDYFGIKPATPTGGVKTPLSDSWKMWVMLGLVIGNLGITAHELYTRYSQGNDYKHWSQSVKYLEQVNQQNFSNESVVVDGRDFQSCTFTNVTLVYRGTKGFTVAIVLLSVRRLLKFQMDLFPAGPS